MKTEKEMIDYLDERIEECQDFIDLFIESEVYDNTVQRYTGMKRAFQEVKDYILGVE